MRIEIEYMTPKWPADRYHAWEGRGLAVVWKTLFGTRLPFAERWETWRLILSKQQSILRRHDIEPLAYLNPFRRELISPLVSSF